jgi:hypothetical protein
MINNSSIQALTEISTLECAEADAFFAQRELETDAWYSKAERTEADDWFVKRELEAQQDERNEPDDLRGLSFSEIFEC